MESGEVRPDVGPMESAIAGALDSRPAAGIDPRDGGAVALARMYARLIDEAAAAAKYADAVEWLRHVVEHEIGDDRTARRHLKTIVTALAEHSVMSDLGPKLQTVLVELKLTPRARAQGKGAPDAPASPAAARMDQLRARRDRKRYPTDLDSASS